MAWKHADTCVLSVILAAAARKHHRPFTSFWLAAIGVARQYKLVYGKAPDKLCSMLRQLGAAIAAGSTLVFLRYPGVVKGMSRKNKCTVPQFWAAHVLYHITPALSLWPYRSQSPWPRVLGIVLHVMWALTTDVNIAYASVEPSALVEGMGVALVAHCMV